MLPRLAGLRRGTCRAPHGARGLKYGADPHREGDERSRAPHGARGLKFRVVEHFKPLADGRAPHGARGLKFCPLRRDRQEHLPSRPAWGAWIEIFTDVKRVKGYESRAPHGARGLKYFYVKIKI